MQNCIGLYEISMPDLFTVRSEMLPFSGNNQNIQMFGFPPERLAIGFMYIIIICIIKTL